MVRGGRWFHGDALERGSFTFFMNSSLLTCRGVTEQRARALEKRFDQSKTPDAQRTRFANLPKESLTVCGYRVRAVATEAYPDLPFKFSKRKSYTGVWWAVQQEKLDCFPWTWNTKGWTRLSKLFNFRWKDSVLRLGRGKKAHRIEVVEDSEDSDPSKISRVQGKHKALHPLSSTNKTDEK